MTMNGFFDLLAGARRVRVGSPALKATLMAVVERMGEHGGEWTCWPSVALIAEETEQGERTVSRHLSDLVDMGLLERRIRGVATGGRGTTVFVLIADRFLAGTPNADLAVRTMTETPNAATPTATAMAVGILMEHPENYQPPPTPPTDTSPAGVTDRRGGEEAHEAKAETNRHDDPDNPRLPARLEAQAQRELAEAIAAGGVRSKTALLAAIRRRIADENLSAKDIEERRRQRLEESEAQLERQRQDAARAVPMPQHLRDAIRSQRGQREEAS